MVKFFEIRKIETSNISLMSQLYNTLSPERLKDDYQSIIAIQRQLFLLKIGTLEQIAVYILDVLSNNLIYNIIIKTPQDLLEVIVLKLLKKEANYRIDLSQFIESTEQINIIKLDYLRESLRVAAESTSHSNILSSLSILSEMYLPHKQHILKNIIVTLASYYDHGISNSINVELIIDLLEDINLGLKEYVETSINQILNTKITFDSFRHSLFLVIDPIEESMTIISKRKDSELERALQTIESSISLIDVQSIYVSLLHLSEVIISTRNDELLTKFEEHKKIIDRCLNKRV